jgi:hypothetical protein
LWTPFGNSKNDNRNIGRLVRRKLIKMRRSPYKRNFPIQLLNFLSNRSSTSFYSSFFSLRKWIRIPKYLNGRVPDSHPKIFLYWSSTSLALPKQNISLLWKLIFSRLESWYKELVPCLELFLNHDLRNNRIVGILKKWYTPNNQMRN